MGNCFKIQKEKSYVDDYKYPKTFEEFQGIRLRKKKFFNQLDKQQYENNDNDNDKDKNVIL